MTNVRLRHVSPEVWDRNRPEEFRNRLKFIASRFNIQIPVGLDSVHPQHMLVFLMGVLSGWVYTPGFSANPNPSEEFTREQVAKDLVSCLKSAIDGLDPLYLGTSRERLTCGMML